IFGEPDAAPARAVTLLAGLPAGRLGGRLDHRARPRVLHMSEAKRDRILTGRGSQLVHERFECKHIGVRAKRAQRRYSYRHRGDEMINDALIGEVIERQRVAVAAASRLWNVDGGSLLARFPEVPAGQ